MLLFYRSLQTKSLHRNIILHLNNHAFSVNIPSCNHPCKKCLKNSVISSPLIFATRSVKTLPSDYGKFSSPGKMESFFEWFTDTPWIHSIEWALTSIHEVTGLHWWSCIALATISLRVLVMTPLFVWQTKANIKYHMFLPVFREMLEKLAAEVKQASKTNNWDDRTAAMHFQKNLVTHRYNMYKQYKVPGIFKRYMLPFVQIPLWVSMSISLRHLTGGLPISTISSPELQHIFFQLSQEGCLWFTNLCQIDGLYIMPILLGLVNLSIIEIHRGDGKKKLEGIGKVLVYAARTLSVILVPIACQMPSGVVFYWLCSSTYGAAQALAFQSQRVKRCFRIPVSSMQSKTPYKDLFSRILFFKKGIKTK